MAKKNGAVGRFMKKPAVRASVKVLSTILKCFLTIFLIGMITASIVGCVMVVYVVTSFKGDEGIPDLKKLTNKETSIVYVKDTQTDEFKEFLRLEGTNNIWTPYEDIPVNMRNAVVAIEDERFYDHYGVDWKRTIAAFANLVLHFNSTEYGGSTITQQLIKVVTGENDHRIERKISEILRAIEMERNHATKDQILTAYLNVLPLTSNITGVGAGANYYFGKDVKDLTLAECAVLASITQNPSRFHPYNRPENVRQRQRTVLYKMNELGMITDDEYRQALGEELHFKSSVAKVAVQDYYTDLLIEDIIADLMDKYGYTYRYAQNLVYYGGLNIYSAEDPAIQERVEAVFANEKNYPAVIKADKENPQTAFFAMDYNGRVIATVGGRGEKTANRVLNRSTQSLRQPGSSMKGISAYAPAIYYNVATYSTKMRDAPIKLSNGKMYPPNYGSSVIKDRGNVILEDALQKSLNTVAVRLVQSVTPAKCFQFVTGQLGITSLVKSRTTDSGQVFSDIDYAPLGLGAMTDGMYAREMTAAYQVFGNGGVYNKPFTYYKVAEREASGKENVLLETQPTHIQSLDVDSAYVMNRLLQRVISGPSGTARALSGTWSKWHTFGKTGTSGTSTQTRDVYFMGGTTYYVGGCWFGYDQNKSLRSSQTSAARNLWSKAMSEIHKGLTPADFTQKGTTVEKAYCRSSGLLATSGCPSTATGVYKASNIPGYCNEHGGSAQPAGEGTTAGNGTAGTSGNQSTAAPTAEQATLPPAA